MADDNLDVKLEKKTVAAATNQCLESFQICLLRASCIHPRELSMVEDQLARLSTWASGNGVFAPSRASMDHRLRYAPEVQSVAIGLLESVDYRIGQCSDIFSVHGKDQKANDLSPLDELLRRSLGDLAAEISHLYKMSNMIRRASKELHILKAKDFQIKDEDGNDVEPLLLNQYKRYIGDRFPTISHAIQARLAETMVLRRKRILYRRFRHGNTAIKPKQVAAQVSVTLPGAQVSAEQVNIQRQGNEDVEEAAPVNAPSHVKSATTLQPEKFKLAKSSPSVVSTSMTVALGNHETLNFPIAPGIRAKRKYERLAKEHLEAYRAAFNTTDDTNHGNLSHSGESIQLSAEQRLKEALKSDLEAIGEITCPYCLYALPAEEVFNEKKWQNHVKIDLDPYVCLAEECNQAEELYKHSETWIHHMQQHSQRWRCPSHRKLGLFTTCEEYMQHMRQAHKTSLSESKLRILANRNVRNTPKLFMSCPLCGKDEAEVGGRLEDHITGHLRSLALKSLPPQEDETQTDEESENNSSGGSQSRSRTTVKNLSDDGSINLLETDNDERRQVDTEDTNFLGNAHPDLDYDSTILWRSWVNDWISNKSMLTASPDSPEYDSFLQLQMSIAEDGQKMAEDYKKGDANPTKSREEDAPSIMAEHESSDQNPDFSIQNCPVLSYINGQIFSDNGSLTARIPCQYTPCCCFEHQSEKSSRDSSSPPAENNPCRKAMLYRSLRNASMAVQLDEAHNFKGAQNAYSEACDLLQHILHEITEKEDKRKLNAIYESYASRVDELNRFQILVSVNPTIVSALDEQSSQNIHVNCLENAVPTSTAKMVGTIKAHTDMSRSNAAFCSYESKPSIRFIAYNDPRTMRPSPSFPTIYRTLSNDIETIRVGRYSKRDGRTLSNEPKSREEASSVGFMSKVVDRQHCEFWYESGQWYIKDVKSSSGTFLNGIRLSPPSKSSKAFPVYDGDIVQLGIDWKGGEEEVFRCVKIKLEF